MIFGIMSTFIPGLPRYIRMLVEYFYVIYGISLSLYLANVHSLMRDPLHPATQ